jgi:hypothetical protein
MRKSRVMSATITNRIKPSGASTVLNPNVTVVGDKKAFQLKIVKTASNPSTMTISKVRRYIVGLRWLGFRDFDRCLVALVL